MKIVIVIIIVLLLLLSMFFNSNYYCSKKLISAILKEDIVEVRRIVEKNPDCINTYPSISSRWWQSAMGIRVCYPLNEACGTNNIEIVKILIENGADVNCNDGLTPLSITYSGKGSTWYELSQILIENGASLNYITEYSGGKSSVLLDILTVRSGSALPGYEPESEDEVLRSFNYALENCDHNNVDWRLVLQHSVSNDKIEIVKLLLDQGYCDVNETTIDGRMSALMFAARDSNVEMVKLLLDYGADKNLKDSYCKTAYDYAVEFSNDNKAVIELLKS